MDDNKERKSRNLANVCFYGSLLLWFHLILFYIINQLYDKSRNSLLSELIGLFFLLWFLFILSSFVLCILSIISINLSNKYYKNKRNFSIIALILTIIYLILNRFLISNIDLMPFL